MLFKIIAFLVAAVPVVLLLRSLFWPQHKARVNESMRAFRRQVDIAVWILLGAVACVVAYGVGRLAWGLFFGP